MLMLHLNLPKGCVFVDFGCGKGRVLLAAAAWSFRRIVGVEFAPKLCEICRRNLLAFQARYKTSAEFVVVQADAVEYRVADDEDVFFFFNPFVPVLAELVLQNIQVSLQSHPRRAWLILLYPDRLVHVFDAQQYLQRIDEFAYGSALYFVYSNRQQTPETKITNVPNRL
jgi:SAM-dependent methyltransferase